MPSFKEVTEAYAGAVGRFNSATKNLRGFLMLFREGVERGLGAPAMSVILFPVNGEPNKDYSGSPDVAQFDGKDSWHVGLAIHLGNNQRVKYRIILDVSDAHHASRLRSDGLS